MYVGFSKSNHSVLVLSLDETVHIEASARKHFWPQQSKVFGLVTLYQVPSASIS